MILKTLPSVFALALMLVGCQSRQRADNESAESRITALVSKSKLKSSEKISSDLDSQSNQNTSDSNRILSDTSSGTADSRIEQDDSIEQIELAEDNDAPDEEDGTGGNSVAEDSDISESDLSNLMNQKLNVEKNIPLCEGSLYMVEWKRQFDEKWMTENPNSSDKSLNRARNVAFLELLVPIVNVSNFDYPAVINSDVLQWIVYFQTKGRKAFVSWLRRAEDIGPSMQRVLEKNGLPKDLLYLAMIESGFNNKAQSSAKAVGPWQFMRPTGKFYNLKINDYVDERRNPEKATEAASEYLAYLYSLFGDWHLAAASYNAGEGRIGKAVRAGGVSDFFKLSDAGMLPSETQSYVPKLIAAMVLSKNAAKFGFEVTAGSRAVKTKQILVNRSFSLRDLADQTGLDREQLLTLNPELRNGITPTAEFGGVNYPLTIPASASFDTETVIASLPEAPTQRKVVAKIRKQDSVKRFASRYGIPMKTLMSANPSLRAGSKLARGQSLTIPVKLGSGQYERLTEGKSSKIKSKQMVSVRVKGKNGKIRTKRMQMVVATRGSNINIMSNIDIPVRSDRAVPKAAVKQLKKQNNIAKSSPTRNNNNQTNNNNNADRNSNTDQKQGNTKKNNTNVQNSKR